MKTILMNTENSKANETHKFVFNLSQRLDLGNLNKHVSLQNLSVYCTQKNIRQQFKNNKLKVIVPTQNDEFELPDGSYSVSNMQDYVKHVIKKHETLFANSPIRVSINRINNRLVFKINDGYKLELQTPKIMKLFGSAKKVNGKTKNG